MKTFLWFSIIFLLALFSYSLILFFQVFDFKLSKERDDWNLFSFFVAGPLNAIIALGSLTITSTIAYFFNNLQKSQKEQRDHEEKKYLILSLFSEFRKKESRQARIDAEKFKKIWEKYSSNVDRKAMIQALINIEELNLPVKGPTVATLKKDYIYGVYDLLDFYSMLKEYKPDYQSLQKVNFFFYDWWRKFLYEVAIKYDKENINRLSPPLKYKLENYKAFLRSVSFTPKLKELDKLCGFHELEETIEIYQDTRVNQK